MDASAKLLERIDMRRGELVGMETPIIRDSQIPVAHILEMMVEGETRETILEQRPSLQPEDLQACLLYAYHAVEERSMISKWNREVRSKRRLRLTPEELEAKRREVREMIEESQKRHLQIDCPSPDDCQCREDDIEVMLEQSGRGRGVIS